MMRLYTMLLFLCAMSLFWGCGRADQKSRYMDRSPTSTPKEGAPVKAGASAALADAIITSEGGRKGQFDAVASIPALSDTDLAKAEPGASDRKIIRNASLTLEVDAPADAQTRLASIAESHGGFVVTSEFKRLDATNQGSQNESVTVVMRVPSSQFNSTLGEIRSLTAKIREEKISGQDVTEEFIDLEARLRSKKALEAQFLDILKQAHKVSDALEVQTQIGEVRTEIERLEGRRRFLENQASLSTITVTLQNHAPVIAATTGGIGESIKQAFGDCVDTAVAIVVGIIRAIGVLIPVSILILLPAALLARVLFRRFKTVRKQQPATE
jgi:hypothetical protein